LDPSNEKLVSQTAIAFAFASCTATRWRFNLWCVILLLLFILPFVHIYKFLTYSLGATPGRATASSLVLHAVGRCTLTPPQPIAAIAERRAWFQPLHLSSENPVSKFAFKFNLYRYNAVLLYGFYRLGNKAGAPVRLYKMKLS
jgi:hypothetical protein